MAEITYYKGNGAYASPVQTFDITSVTAERMPNGAIYYFSFNTDGTMFVLHTGAVMQPDGTSKAVITGWDQFSGNTLLQSGTCSLDLQPFLDNMGSRNPSSTKAMNYVFGGDDTHNGSNARDNMMAQGGNDTLLGNGGNDHMNGGQGNDVLTGGMGTDKEVGGAGLDQFVFNTAGEGGDTITDFTSGQDHLVLSSLGFGLTGPLSEGHGFGYGTTATGTGPELIYDQASGALRYDADGAGAGAAVLLATLTNHAALVAGDIIIA